MNFDSCYKPLKKHPIKNTNVVLVEFVLTSPVIHTIAIEKLNRNTIIITAQLKHKTTSVNLVDLHNGGLLQMGAMSWGKNLT